MLRPGKTSSSTASFIGKNLPEAAKLDETITKLDVDIKKAIEHGIRADSQLRLNQNVQKVKERIREMDSKIARLETIANQLKKPGERLDTIEAVKKHVKSSEQNLASLRKRTLTAMEYIEGAERDALFQGAPDGEVRSGSSGRGMREDASKTTESLSHLLSKMNSQVEQSSNNLNTLVGSSAVIKETEDEFANMGACIESAGKLLSKWDRRELTDKILIFLAIVMFYVTVLYILKKRLGSWFWWF